ncbi:MAG: GNAT family N-acetyltransferase [Parvibaculaceae bacterium]
MAAFPDYRFKPLSVDDLPLIRRWLDAPHVRRWYGGAREAETIGRHIREPDVSPYLVLANGYPIAYLQRYDVRAWRDHPYADTANVTAGIDQFIGPTAFVGRGHGSAFIRAYLDLCRAQGLSGVLTDPDPANGRAVAAYRNAGFRPLVRRRYREGEVLLMTADLNDIKFSNRKKSRNDRFLPA